MAGVLTDVGFTKDPELETTAKVFTSWCNAAGGIDGRKLVADIHDTQLLNVVEAMSAACGSDFALAGGSAALDGLGVTTRLKCLLPDFDAQVVMPQNNGSGLQVYPIPWSHTYSVYGGYYNWLINQKYPDSKDARRHPVRRVGHHPGRRRARGADGQGRRRQGDLQRELPDHRRHRLDAVRRGDQEQGREGLHVLRRRPSSSPRSSRRSTTSATSSTGSTPTPTPTAASSSRSRARRWPSSTTTPTCRASTRSRKPRTTRRPSSSSSCSRSTRLGSR